MPARSKRTQPANRLNAFDDKTDLEQVADEIFGASAPPTLDTGRIVARPIAIDEIWADVRQPRRAIPASIRLVWNGSPADVPDLLNTWGAVAANAAGRTINIQDIIQGEGDGVDTDGTPPIYESFISLLRLAGSILREGLINPITIIDQRDRHLIESGERRWLAYWLLRLHTQAGDDYARVPAAVVSGADSIFRQAAENTVRRSLNAVGMARQLALLIMAVRGQDQYADYDQIVPPGGSDRRYYAQVADGNTHRIPKGAGERIEAAMGLSKEQLSRYRDILRITADDELNDILWMRGDVEDWPESAFRDVNRLPIGNLRTILSRDAWSLSDIREAVATLTPVKAQPPTPLVQAPPNQGYNAAEAVEARRVLDAIRSGFARVYGMEDSTNGVVQIAANRATRLLNQAQTFYDRNRLVSAQASVDEATHILDEAATAADEWENPNPPTPSETGSESNPLVDQLGGIGATVKLRSGHTGKLVSVNGRMATVVTPNGPVEQYIEHLRKADAAPAASMRRIYDNWRAAYPKDDLLLITQDGDTYLAIGQDDYTLRSKTFEGDGRFVYDTLRPGHIGATGSADHTLVAKIDADLFAEVVGSYNGNVVVISYSDLDEKMQHIAGMAFRAHNIPLNSLPQPDSDDQDDPDEDDEPTQQPASDKSTSDGQNNQPVVDRGEPIFNILMELRTLARITEDENAANAADRLLGMTWDAAKDMADKGQLTRMLEIYFDSINAALSAWSTKLGEFLDDLHKQLADE